MSIVHRFTERVEMPRTVSAAPIFQSPATASQPLPWPYWVISETGEIASGEEFDV